MAVSFAPFREVLHVEADRGLRQQLVNAGVALTNLGDVLKGIVVGRKGGIWQHAVKPWVLRKRFEGPDDASSLNVWEGSPNVWNLGLRG